jgi:hypothetical protein
VREIESALAGAIQSAASGRVTRNAEVFLAAICAKHLTDQLGLSASPHASHRSTASPMATANASVPRVLCPDRSAIGHTSAPCLDPASISTEATSP